MTDRRPLKTRSRHSARWLASLLARASVSPNSVSLAGIVFSAGAAAALASLPRSDSRGQISLLVLAAVCIQLRLLCNMLDGLIAVEGGKHTPSGILYNEIPDRIDDVLILVGAGYAVSGSAGLLLGWLAAALAIMTAYVRLLGGSLQLVQDFTGPMAKPQRMALLTVACLASIIEVIVTGYRGVVLAGALIFMIFGMCWTLYRRVHRIHRQLIGRP